MNLPDEPLQDISAVILINVGAFTLQYLNPVLGSLSLILSVGYVGFKLYREITDFWNEQKNNN
jgi:hypothetical protein